MKRPLRAFLSSSFAEEDRDVVEAIKAILSELGIKCYQAKYVTKILEGMREKILEHQLFIAILTPRGGGQLPEAVSVEIGMALSSQRKILFLRDEALLVRDLYRDYPQEGFDREALLKGDAKELDKIRKAIIGRAGEYGYELGVPTSWDMIKDVAEFFYDPDNEFYGVAIYGDNGYDSLAMFAMQTIRSYGGDLGNFETFEVDGYLNSPGAIAGIEYYRELFQYVPPGFGDAFFVATNDAFVNGIVPMATNYFAFFPGLAVAETNPFADVTGYSVLCPKGEVEAPLGDIFLVGAGTGLLDYSDTRNWVELDEAVLPDPESNSLYNKYFEQYKQIYLKTRDNMRDMALILSE